MAEETGQQSTVKSIKDTVATAITNSGSKVFTTVVDTLANTEIEKRSSTMLKAYSDIVVKTKELDKVRADVETFDGDGNALPKVFSKAQNEARKKAIEVLEKVTKAFELAADKGDFSKLYEMYK